MNGEYYANLLDHFNHVVKEEHPHLAKKKILFHQDNVRVHTCVLPMSKFHELGYKLLQQPPYSPDLAPSDYFLFPNMKKWLGGNKCGSYDEVIDETNVYFEGLVKSYFLDGIQKIENR